MSPVAWRLLPLEAGRAAWNMSVDEALLECAPDAPPTLRLYTWERPSVSLGYRQKDPDWLARARALDVDVVRRCSGGGTVIHAGDLTYAVVAPLDGSALPAGLGASFCWIRDALLEGLGRAGLAAEPASGAESADRSAVCFSASTGTEIELGDRKLVGSAQRRTSWGLLQHGSVRLADDRSWYRALMGSDPGPPPGACPDSGTVANGIVRAFESALDAPLRVAALSPAEHERARVRATARSSTALLSPPLRLRETPVSADSLP